MTEINKQPTTEAGRSMVEMLGVLAVIGVLSIGGVAGYNLGMEKQRANELLEASLQRAYTVSAQLLTGRNASLVEFNQDTRKAGGEFETTVETAYSGGIGIKITGVNQNICKALVRSMTDNSPLRGVSLTGTQNNITENDCQETNNLTLLYNDDMSLRENSGNGNENNDSACADVTCDDGLTCFHGECKCSNGTLMCGEQCCADGTYCGRDSVNTSQRICVTPTGDCTKNSDCGEGMYCKFTGGSRGPEDGICTAKETLTEYTLALPAGALTVYKGGSMNWWSAQNLCASHGKQMVTMADLDVQDTGSNIYCYFDNTVSDYATKPCICSGGDSDCSQTDEALYPVGGELWLADYNSNANAGYARFVSIYGGYVGNKYRDSNSFALCL